MPGTSVTPDYEVLIVGAGFGGVGAAIALRDAGIHNILIVDKWDRVGGTWLANTYPGVAVDVPSFIYSFSYAQRADWSRLFAPGEEIQRYIEDVVDEFVLRPKLRLNTMIERAEWDEQDHLWRAWTDGGDVITARFAIGAVGGLEQPKLPDIDGIADFPGKLMHTALWDHDYDLAGKRVAVIGTGATALQLIPELADEVAHLSVFQRTPIWVAPKPDFATNALTRALIGRPPMRQALRAVGDVAVEVGLGGALLAGERATPLIRVAEGALKLWMRTQVPDPELREKLTPQYMLGCKRPSISNRYLRTFTRPHVDLVTTPIDHVGEAGVVTADGVTHEVGAIVCATGFKVLEQGATPPFPLIGRGGVALADFWHENRHQAYQGVSVPGFPNLFLTIGPYGFAPGSYLWMVEATSAHAARAITAARKRGATACEIRQEPHDRYFEKSLARSARLPLLTDSCAGSNTYYIDYQGLTAPVRPSTRMEMSWQNRHFPLDDYSYTCTGRSAESRKSAVASS